MEILKTVEKFPGGLMVGPLLIAAVIHTWAPGLVEIGGPTTALFSASGTMCLAGLLLFIIGSQLPVKQIGSVLKRHGTLLVVKLLAAFLVGMLLMNAFGAKGIFGISTMAFVCVLASNNPGVFLALTKTYGDEIDHASFGIWNVAGMPTIPVLILGAASGASFDYMALISLLVPFLLGIILGNADPDIRKLMAPGSMIMLPFLGFCFGISVNLVTAFKSGLQGLLLTVVFYLISTIPAFFTDRFLLKRPGYGSIATCCVAGLAIGAPAQIAEAVPAHAPYLQTATAQIALVMILTTVITPMLTRFIAARFGTASSSPVKKGAEKNTLPGSHEA